MNIYLNAFLDNNLGDDLMVIEIARRFAEHTFFITSGNSTVKNSFKEIHNIVFVTKKDTKSTIKSCQVYLTIGGSMYQMNTLKSQVFSIIKTLRYIGLKLRGKKIGSIGSNLGPFRNKLSKILLNIEFSLLDLNTVRDAESIALLDSFIGLTNYHHFEDIVYSSNKVESMLKLKASSNLVETEVLGISTYRSIYKPDLNYFSYEYIANTINSIIKTKDVKILLFAFDSENENDLCAAHHIFNLIEKKDNVEIIPYLGNVNVFLNKYYECDSMISIRFHSAILSEMMQIPFLPICYSNKMKNLLEDSGFKGRFIEFDNLSNEDSEVASNQIINSQGLFDNFSKLEDKISSAKGHFNEVENLFRKLEARDYE